MKCIILVAGYATRLYPLTKNYPKPLIDINGKKILEWLIDDLEKDKNIDEYILISNHKFIDIFNKWKETRKENITIIDDGSITNETRLGAVIDLKLAIDKLNIDDDILVMAGDNVLDFSLDKFINYYKKKNTSVVMRNYIDEIEKLRKTGVLELDGDLVIDMEEKPDNPKSHYGCPPFYIYKKEDLKLIDKAINNKCATDAPGSLVSFMCKETKINAFLMPGSRYDIGSIESLENVRKIYKGIEVK